MRRTAVQSQPQQIICEILSRKITSRKRTGGVVQGIDPEFQPQYHKKKKKKEKETTGPPPSCHCSLFRKPMGTALAHPTTCGV
jgi:hypothetical protein